MTTINEFMSTDHDRLDNIFSELMPLGEEDGARSRALFSEFRSGLERHIAWEEELLFPIFEQATGMRDAGPTAVMRMEHRQIKEILEQIDQTLQAENPMAIGQLANALLEVLSSHNQKEEHILYPAIDNVADEQEKQQAIKQMSATAA